MFKILAIFLFCVLAYTNAAVSLYPEEEKPAEFANQNGCYLSSLNRVIPFDKPYHPKDDTTCLQYRCSKASKLTQVFSCGAVAAGPGCNLVEDLTKDYPDCCPKVKECH